jgi:hypothetical protein
VEGILSAESGMFNITAKYDGTHRGICVQVFQDVTFCQKCRLSKPSSTFPRQELQNAIIHLLADTADAEGVVEMLQEHMGREGAANRKMDACLSGGDWRGNV